MIDALIHSPYPLNGSQGNAISALRLERILIDAGFSVEIEAESYAGQSAAVLIALNARRSAEAVDAFLQKHPERPVVIILTGTDINHPDAERHGSATWRCMEKATQLVLLHDASLAAVPEPFRDKCTVIYPSVTLPEGMLHTANSENFTIVMAGNMRREKNPELAISAASQLPDTMVLHIYGEFPDAIGGKVVNHGMVSHDAVLASMSRAHLLLNTSHQEGGANAICEAICMGLPVIASAIPGNIGMLGSDYAGLFPPDDLSALVQMLEKAAMDSEFYEVLKKQISNRAPLFTYESESAAWIFMLNTLIK